MRENYVQQVKLLLDILPVVMKDRRLALGSNRVFIITLGLILI